MHIPDGFIDAGTSAGAAIVATGGLGASLRRAGQVLDERRVPLAGMVAAFVFAAQMLNFPVAAGTSGHLLGGTLAAVLVGPAVAVVCLSVVLVVQALLFADGGLSALGLNVLNIALVATLGGYATFVALQWLLGRVRGARRSGPSGPSDPAGGAGASGAPGSPGVAGRSGPVVVAAGVAAGLSVVLSAGVFAVEYALGGAGGASPGTVAGAMLGVHVLIGVGEGVITALVVSAVLATRPDLVWGARHRAGARATGAGGAGPRGEPGRRGEVAGAATGAGGAGDVGGAGVAAGDGGESARGALAEGEVVP